MRKTHVFIFLMLLLALVSGLWMSNPTTAQDEEVAPTPTWTPLPPPTLTPGAVRECPTPMNLVVNLVVYVRSGVTIRHQPNLSGAPVNYYVENMVAVITDGPVCANGYNWWRIRGPGNNGWIAEGSAEGGYFLQSAGVMSDGSPTLWTCSDPLTIPRGDTIVRSFNLRLREEPGFGGRVLTVVPHDATVQVIDGPTCADGYNWWHVQTEVVGIPYDGWMAEGPPGDYWMVSTTYLESENCHSPLPLDVGERAYVYFRNYPPRALRAAPGRDAPMLYTLVRNVPLVIEGGPVCVDEINWWQVRVLASTPVVGWLAEGGPGNYVIRSLPSN